jgi:3-oxoacyl-[acyl-carrier protein] reductase
MVAQPPFPSTSPNKVSKAKVCLNVSEDASVEQVLKTITERYGAVSILVNNAGITRDNLLMRMKSEEWDSVINTNLTSLYRLSKACLRAMMKARSGRIINIASVVGPAGMPGKRTIQRPRPG